jgi:hypothetical protein
VVWVVSSLQRVGPADPAGTTVLAQMTAARGEYESFQIIVRAPESGGLTNVNVAVTELTGSGGHVVSKNNIALFREQYVQVVSASPDWGGSNRPLGPGWYPDGLIPFVDPDAGSALKGGSLHAAPFNVPAGKNQPVWVDVFVPRTAAAGDYTSRFIVSSDQGSTEGRIALRVWHFTLPLQSTLKSAFVTTQEPADAVARTLLRNKISPLNVTPKDARRLMAEFGLNSSNLGIWSGADASNCSMSPPPPADAVRAAAARYPPGLNLFNFTADEIDWCRGCYSLIREWGRALHEAGVKNLITMAPVLLDDGSGAGRSAVDIWVVLPMTYDKAAKSVAQALAKGDEVWSYNTLVQDPYSPKWEIDFAPINFRIQPGFISQSLGLTGLMCWRVDSWSPAPWTNVNNAGKFSANNYPGEGMLVYPGAPVGMASTAPSMRLKWIRDGVEDYEYVAQLKKAGYGDWALQIARGVGPDWTRWTQDPDALESARRKLGEKLDEMASAAKRESQH